MSCSASAANTLLRQLDMELVSLKRQVRLLETHPSDLVCTRNKGISHEFPGFIGAVVNGFTWLFFRCRMLNRWTVDWNMLWRPAWKTSGCQRYDELEELVILGGWSFLLCFRTQPHHWMTCWEVLFNFCNIFKENMMQFEHDRRCSKQHKNPVWYSQTTRWFCPSWQMIPFTLHLLLSLVQILT